MVSCRKSTSDTATTPSIKDEPTESLLPARPLLSLNESTTQPTVKCEWSLAGFCACADGKCDDCQEATDREDEKDIILTTPVAAPPFDSPENDETQFHPPIWEDCEEAEEAGNASDAASEAVTQILETIDNNFDNGPMIEQFNTEDNFPMSTRNQNASKKTKMEKESQMALNVDSVSPFVLRRSTRLRKSTVNYSVLFEAEEETDTEEINSDEGQTEPETETDTDGEDPSEAEESASIAAFPCVQCGKRFAQRYNLRRHEKTFHHQIKPSRPNVCPAADCGKAFESQSALARHTIIHSGLRPFTCATCGSAFNRKSNLTAHRVSHTDDRPYVCSLCKMAFKVKATLVRHTGIRHSSAPKVKQSFPCAHCGWSFTQKGSLKRHGQRKIPCASRYAPNGCVPNALSTLNPNLVSEF